MPAQKPTKRHLRGEPAGHLPCPSTDSRECPLSEPGEGYRLLKPEEKLVEGDEFCRPDNRQGGSWTLSCNAEYNGGHQSPGFVYRREITREEAS